MDEKKIYKKDVIDLLTKYSAEIDVIPYLDYLKQIDTNNNLVNEVWFNRGMCCVIYKLIDEIKKL